MYLLILDPRSSILDPRSSILDPRSSILDPRSSILDPRSSILDPRSSILDPRSSILVFQETLNRMALHVVLLHTHEQRAMDSYRQWQISLSVCAISRLW